MNMMTDLRPGRCTNTLYCRVASAGEPLLVPVDARFVCAFCGKPLAEPPPPRRGLGAGAIAGGGMAFTGVLLFAAGIVLGGKPVRHAPVARLPAHAAIAASAAPASTFRTPVVPIAQPVRTVATPAAPPAAAAIQDQPFSARPVAGGSPDYPATTTTAGNVTVSCRIETSGIATGCRIVSNQGGRAFSRQVLNWLNGGVRFAPIVRAGVAVAETHQWSIAFQPR